MTFNPEEFLESDVSLSQVTKLRKDDLKTLADHIKVSYETRTDKRELQALVIHELVNRGNLDESDEYEFQSEKKSSSEILMLKLKLKAEAEERAFRLKELELQNEQVQLQARDRAEADHRAFKLRELELQNQQLAIEKGTPAVIGRPSSIDSDITRYVKFVPRFNEKDIDNYFLHFEKVANTLKWPKTMWSVLLQSQLTGKAQEVFASLSIVQCIDYEVVKREVLKAYELVPEAYRQMFRKSTKLPNQTHLEFAHHKEILFDRWCNSIRVEKNFGKLRELMLLEEFKNSLGPDVRTHLDERKVSTMADAAVAADEYMLTHKSIFSQKHKDSPSIASHPVQVNIVKHGNSYKGSASNSSNYRVNNVQKPMGFSGKSSSFFAGNCNYCKKYGHRRVDCYSLLRAEEKKKNPVALVSTLSSSSDTSVQLVGPNSDSVFKSFLSQGTVSCVESTDRKALVILRDTGAAQTLMLDNVLPQLTSDSRVVISSLGGYASVPLCDVQLNCNSVTGKVSVGVVSSLPVSGIDMLLGNDLAGDKVVISPQVTCDPIDSVSLNKLEDKFPYVFPSCAVTRSQAKQKADKDEIDLDDSLGDTFMNQDVVSDDKLSVNQRGDPELSFV